MLDVLQTTDAADLPLIQRKVKKELDALEAALPSTKVTATFITTDYLVALTDKLVIARPAASINVALPPASSCKGLRFGIKNGTTAAVVHLRGRPVNGAFEAIDGAQKYNIAAGVIVNAYSDGAQWWLV